MLPPLTAADIEQQAVTTGAETSLSSALERGHAEAVLSVVESSLRVRRRYQFFVWTQSYLGALLPHDLSICAAYQRAHQSLVFEAFNTRPLPEGVLPLLNTATSVLVQAVVASWVAGGGVAVVLDLASLARRTGCIDPQVLHAAGAASLLVHGVSRPQRPDELESLFMFASHSREWGDVDLQHFELVLPHLHCTYLRVQRTEQDLSEVATVTLPRRGGEPAAPITERERQILSCVREGKSNHEIGKMLSISALTVKNHVQKILRKLNAANRAQAVARAMALKLLDK